MNSLMSGMGGMGGMGMDSGSGGMFVADNQSLARTYWYIIAAIVGFACLLKGLQALESSNRSVLSTLLSLRGVASVRGCTEKETDGDILLAENGQRERFQFPIPRDPATSGPKHTQRSLPSQEKSRILRHSPSVMHGGSGQPLRRWANRWWWLRIWLSSRCS